MLLIIISPFLAFLSLISRVNARRNAEIKSNYEHFSLRHVIPAEQALESFRAGDVARSFSLIQDVYRGFSLLSEPVAIQTKEEFLRKITLIKNEQFSNNFYSRLPNILPQPEDHETVVSFAKMAANSYIARATEGWRNSTGYIDDDGFGWNSTGLRGHIFSNDDRSIIIISFKGTSTILHGGETVARDKYMDNIMFSCCCARVDISWTPVCGCYKGSEKGKPLCDATCLADTVRNDPNAYYYEALAVTQLVIARYPKAQIWFTGHSLGGAIAALMAVTVRKTSTITFSSPGPYLYARHMGLHSNTKEGTQWQYPIWNFGLSTDPIFTGTCTGLITSCYLSGYAMETGCRHGMDCLFEINSWQPDVSTHRIDWLIDHVLNDEEKFPLPPCIPNDNCTDCTKWTFVS